MLREARGVNPELDGWRCRSRHTVRGFSVLALRIDLGGIVELVNALEAAVFSAIKTASVFVTSEVVTASPARCRRFGQQQLPER